MPKGQRREKVINREEAVQFALKRLEHNDVVAWNVTKAPTGLFEARPSCTVKWGAGIKLTGVTLEDLRDRLPPNLLRYPGDPEVGVEEVWI